jgi:hypothetical protein
VAAALLCFDSLVWGPGQAEEPHRNVFHAAGFQYGLVGVDQEDGEFLVGDIGLSKHLFWFSPCGEYFHRRRVGATNLAGAFLPRNPKGLCNFINRAVFTSSLTSSSSEKSSKLSMIKPDVSSLPKSSVPACSDLNIP